MITFSRSGHYICVCRWGRRFRLPSHYVHAQTAPSLAPRCLRGNLSLCHLAISRLHAEESIWAEVGRQECLPHTHPRPLVRRSGPRNRQSYVWACLATGCARSTSGGRCDPLRRKWKTFLRTESLGGHAKSCAPTVAAQYPLPVITRWLKGSTARQANLILDRTGAFWQDESFDHRVRNDRRLRVLSAISNTILSVPGWFHIRKIGFGRVRGWQAKAPAPLSSPQL
jgi:hypothetical protein